MIEFEFQEQIGRLKRSFGQQVNEEFVASLWRRFGRIEARVFALAVDFMIEERASLKISVMAEAINTQSRKQMQVEADRDLEKLRPCNVCETAGTIFAETLDGRARIMVRCNCEPWGSEVADPELPMWEPNMAREFRRVKINIKKPNFSELRENPKIKDLPDDEFWNHPFVKNAIDQALSQQFDWWRTQKNYAVLFWREYYMEGLNK